MDEQQTQYYKDRIAEYKRMVSLRQDECEQVGELLEKEARHLSRIGTLFKIILLTVAAIISIKSGIELTMHNMNVSSKVMDILSIVFLIFGGLCP